MSRTLFNRKGFSLFGEATLSHSLWTLHMLLPSSFVMRIWRPILDRGSVRTHIFGTCFVLASAVESQALSLIPWMLLKQDWTHKRSGLRASALKISMNKRVKWIVIRTVSATSNNVTLPQHQDQAKYNTKISNKQFSKYTRMRVLEPLGRESFQDYWLLYPQRLYHGEPTNW